MASPDPRLVSGRSATMPHVPGLFIFSMRSNWEAVQPFHRVSFVTLLSNPESRRIQHVQKRIGSHEEG